jgi:hypothetical protein
VDAKAARISGDWRAHASKLSSVTPKRFNTLLGVSPRRNQSSANSNMSRERSVAVSEAMGMGSFSSDRKS